MTSAAIPNVTAVPSGSRQLWRRVVAAAVFVVSLILYIATAEPTVSFWDCPEYVTTATRLEPGHPPGNPFWTLTARVFTLFAPSAEWQPLAVNIMSGVCSALAVMLLFLTLTILIPKLLRSAPPWLTLGASAVGAMALAVSDTFWFSAVEAEVYAMSAMLTALVIWLTFLCGERRDTPGAERYLILIAYISGLSIGVHQLNLLALPAIALIILFYSRSDLPKWLFAGAMLTSLLIIAAVLFGMMPGVLAGAAATELWCVNTLGLPLHSGVLIYVGATLLSLIAACLLTGRRPGVASYLVAGISLWLSGILSFGGSLMAGALLSAAVVVVLIIFKRKIPSRAVNISVWSVAFLFLGYCSYALILIRGAANPPMNQGAPSDIFALTSYIARDQYGSAPLLYGPTPYSSPLYREEWRVDSLTKDSTAVYAKFYRRPGKELYTPVKDSDGRVRYALIGDDSKLEYPPELNMWFPRIHSSDPGDIESYKGWTGMNDSNMVAVEASYAVDSLGNAVGRWQADADKRVKEKKLRPTYLQNLMMLGGYQVSYMYLRYLFWNFAGRQNEVYAQGESDAGNFLTGIPPADALMLQHPELLPRDIGRDNPGHHNYYLLPLLLGVLGLAFQLSSGREGKRQFAVVMLLFVLTGIAIVVYLNQTPGQPRERDYSFVGSFYASCIWIGLGAAFLFDCARMWWRRSRPGRVGAVLLVAAVVGVPALMAVENFPDHNRAGRYITRDFALNVLEPLPKNAVIFVNGDNFTFPLWYLQESEGVRPDVRTVNLAYLSTPWYVMQLVQKGPAGDGLRLSIPDSLRNPLGINKFGVVDIGVGESDASTALRRLFTESRGEGRPRLPAGTLRFAIPGSATDSVRVDLRDISGGHGYLRLSSLVMLDILASNPDRPILWHCGISSSVLPLQPWLATEGHSVRFYGAAMPDTLVTNARIMLRWRDGGLPGAPYVDVPGRQQVAIHRGYMARIALGLARRGNPGDLPLADSLISRSLAMMPPQAVPFSSYTYKGERYSDAVVAAEVYATLWRATGRDAYRRKAADLLRREYARNEEYRRYLDALTPRYRKFTKGATRLSADHSKTLEVWSSLGLDSLALKRSEK